MPSTGVADEMNRPGLEPGDEARNVRDVLLHGEIIAFAVPFLRPAMPEADRDRAIMRAERLHLSRPMAVVANVPCTRIKGSPAPRSTNAIS
jgi:hypothetical protein